MSMLARQLVRRGLNMASIVSRLQVRAIQNANTTTGFDRMTFPALDNLRKIKEPAVIEQRRLFWIIRNIGIHGTLFAIFTVIFALTIQRLFFFIYDLPEW